MGTYSSAIFKKVLGTLFGSDSGVAVWGGVTGTLANQTDLVAAIAAATGGWAYVILGADYSTSSTTASDVTGMAFTPAADAHYEVEGLLILRADTDITNAPVVGMTWPTGLSDGVGFMQAAGGTQATTPRYGPVTAAMEHAVLNFTNGNTTTSFPTLVKSNFLSGATPVGTFKLTLKAETAANQVTMRKGSYFRYRRIA